MAFWKKLFGVRYSQSDHAATEEKPTPPPAVSKAPAVAISKPMPPPAARKAVAASSPAPPDLRQNELFAATHLPDAQMRFDAMKWLIERRHDRFFKLLNQSGEDPDKQQFRSVLIILMEMGEPYVHEIIPSKKNGSDVRWSSTVSAVATIGSPAIPWVIKWKNEIGYSARQRFADDVSSAMGKALVEPLFERLFHGACDPNEVRAIAKILGRVGGPTIVQRLEYLKNSDARAWFDAVIADGQNEKALLEALQGGTDGIRLGAIGALARLKGCKEDVPKALVATFQDSNEEIRLAAINALACVQNDDSSLNDALVVLLQDSNDQMRLAAEEALRKIGYKPKDLPTRVKISVAVGDFSDLLKCGDLGLQVLDQHLVDRSENMRLKVVYSLAKASDPRAVGFLIPRLADSSYEVRKTAGAALGGFNYCDASFSRELIDALKRTDSKLRSATIGAIRDGKMSGAAEAIIALIDRIDVDDSVRYAIIYALTTLKEPRGIEPVIRLLGSMSTPKAPYDTISWLGESKDIRAFEPIMRIVLDDSCENLHRCAAVALGQINRANAYDRLMAVFQDPSNKSRCHAAKALGHIGDSRAVPSLIAAITDKNDPARGVCAIALGDIGDARAVQPLRSAISEDPYETDRLNFACSLGKLGDPWVFQWVVSRGSEEWIAKMAEATFKQEVSVAKVPTSMLRVFAKMANYQRLGQQDETVTYHSCARVRAVAVEELTRRNEK
jgi:HEAT repeat protein